MINHVVMFKLADQADVPEAVARIAAMAGRIPSLNSIRVGRDLNRGPTAFDVVLVSEHDDEDSLAAYATDPVHVELLDWLKPRWTERAVVDTNEFV